MSTYTSGFSPTEGLVRNELDADPISQAEFEAASGQHLTEEVSGNYVAGDVVSTVPLRIVPRTITPRSADQQPTFSDDREVDHEGTKIMNYQDLVKMLNASRKLEPPDMGDHVLRRASQNKIIRMALSCLATSAIVATGIAGMYEETTQPTSAALGTLRPKEAPPKYVVKPVVSQEQLEAMPATKAAIKQMARTMAEPLYVKLSDPNDHASDRRSRQIRANMEDSFTKLVPRTLPEIIEQAKYVGQSMPDEYPKDLLAIIVEAAERSIRDNNQYIPGPRPKAFMARVVHEDTGTATTLTVNYDASDNMTGASLAEHLLNAGPGSLAMWKVEISLQADGFTLVSTGKEREVCKPDDTPHIKRSTNKADLAPSPTAADLTTFRTIIEKSLNKMATAQQVK